MSPAQQNLFDDFDDDDEQLVTVNIIEIEADEEEECEGETYSAEVSQAEFYEVAWVVGEDITVDQLTRYQDTESDQLYAICRSGREPVLVLRSVWEQLYQRLQPDADDWNEETNASSAMIEQQPSDIGYNDHHAEVAARSPQSEQAVTTQLEDAVPRPSIQKRIGGFFKAIPMIIGFGLFLLVGVRGCITTVWRAPDEPTAYLIDGVDGRWMSVTFLPKYRMLTVYHDPNEESTEAVLSKIRSATYGQHLLGPVWNVSEEGDSLFGIRWVTGGAKPVRMRFEVLNKYHEGYGDSSFPPIGGKSIETLYFRADEMKCEGMWFQMAPDFFTVVEPILIDLERGLSE